MDFLCVDVETANESHSSICQIGIASFAGGHYVDGVNTLVNPEDVFLDVNVDIHGITAEIAAKAATFKQIYPIVLNLLVDKIVVSHTPFDRISLDRACAAAGFPAIPCRWLDSARVVRRAYPDQRYGLKFIARYLGIEFKHHDALEDARCSGEILARAILDTGIDLDGWFRRVQQPVFLGGASVEVNREGPLFGEVVVFTGELSMLRRTAATLAAQAGCEVMEGVTKHTTILIVGNQDAIHGIRVKMHHSGINLLSLPG